MAPRGGIPLELAVHVLLSGVVCTAVGACFVDIAEVVDASGGAASSTTSQLGGGGATVGGFGGSTGASGGSSGATGTSGGGGAVTSSSTGGDGGAAGQGGAGCSGGAPPATDCEALTYKGTCTANDVSIFWYADPDPPAPNPVECYLRDCDPGVDCIYINADEGWGCNPDYQTTLEFPCSSLGAVGQCLGQDHRLAAWWEGGLCRWMLCTGACGLDSCGRNRCL